MADIIGSEPIPMPPPAQEYPGAYLPGLLHGQAASGQYGAPLSVPGGPVVMFGSGHDDTAPDGSLQPGGMAGGARSARAPGVEIRGRADGT